MTRGALAAFLAVGALGVVATDGGTASATVSNGGESLNVANPFPVVLKAAGVPAAGQGVWSGTGFVAGDDYTVALCDGVTPGSAGWSEASDCDYANTASVATASGALTIDTNSNAFPVFHGLGPSGLFNCLTAGDDPNGTSTAVGAQKIDPNVPSWGASTVGANGGGMAPCQIYIYTDPNAYTASTDLAFPVTNLGGSPSTTAPATPTNVVATPGSAGSGDVSVSFSPGSGGTAASSYSVSINDTTASTTSSKSTPSSPLALAGLTPGDTYTFTVTAVSASNVNSSPSTASAPVTLPKVPAPSVPGTPVATAGPGGSGTASLTWSPSTNASSYSISGTSSGTGAPVSVTSTTAGTSGSPVTVSGLTIGQPYTFAITATGGGGTSSASPASNAITDLTEPAPTGLSFTPTGQYGSGTGTISLSPGANGQTPTLYTVTLTPSGGSSSTVTGTSSPIALSGLVPGTAYTATATATTTPVGATTPVTSGSSSQVSFTPPAVQVPPAPNVTSVSTGTHSATVTFATGDPANPVTYTATATPLGGGTQVVAPASSTSPITVTGLTAGQTYTFAVSAANTATGSTPLTGSTESALIPAGPSVSGTPPGAAAGSAYTYQFAVGGTYTTVSASGTLPPGLSLSASGALTGVPTHAGRYSFTVVAQNSVGSATDPVTVVVQAGAPARIVIGRGNRQTAAEGRAFARRLTVTVVDQYGDAVPDVRVTFRVTRGPARFGRSATSVGRTGGAGGVTAGRLLAQHRTGVIWVRVSAAGVGGSVRFTLHVRI